jgi:hypothetical protein
MNSRYEVLYQTHWKTEPKPKWRRTAAADYQQQRLLLGTCKNVGMKLCGFFEEKNVQQTREDWDWGSSDMAFEHICECFHLEDSVSGFSQLF